MTSIAGGVQGRRRLGDVLADDRHFADLAVAEAQLVVGEPDGARVVRTLGLLSALVRKAMPRDGSPRADARRPCIRQRSRQTARLQPLPPLRRPAQRFRRLADVVLKQPGLGQRAADLDLFVAVQPGDASAPGPAASPPRLPGPPLEGLYRACP